LEKVLQKFNINNETKSVSTSLVPHFKLKANMSPITVEEHEYITHVPYASAVGSLMYATVCTRPNLSQAVSMVSRYMHNPGRGHWKAVKWILRYIKGTITLVWYSRRMLLVRRSVSDMLIPTTQEISTNAGPQWDMCLHCPKHRSASALLYCLLSHCLLQRLNIWP